VHLQSRAGTERSIFPVIEPLERAKTARNYEFLFCHLCGILFRTLFNAFQYDALFLILRSFIAIELPEAVKSALTILQHDLKKCGADIRWVKPGNIHLTLKFLGDIDEKNIGNIVKQMEGACAAYPFFDLAISGIGVFPHLKSPRVLWAGIQSVDILEELHRAIDHGMASLGFKPEGRKFAPHLTLGRFRSLKGREALIEKIELHKNDQFGLIDVRSILLMRSDLSPAGAQYSRIAEVNMAQ